VGAEEGGRAFESKEIPGLKVYVVPAKGKNANVAGTLVKRWEKTRSILLSAKGAWRP